MNRNQRRFWITTHGLSFFFQRLDERPAAGRCGVRSVHGTASVVCKPAGMLEWLTFACTKVKLDRFRHTYAPRERESCKMRRVRVCINTDTTTLTENLQLKYDFPTVPWN